MAISTFTIQFNEYELETISSALADYRDYAEGATDPILATVCYTHLTLPTIYSV